MTRLAAVAGQDSETRNGAVSRVANQLGLPLTSADVFIRALQVTYRL